MNDLNDLRNADPGLPQLLSIDVDAEVRKLCSEQLGSPGEQLVELVRLLNVLGAQQVDCRIKRRSIVLSARGAVIPQEQLEHLVTVANSQATANARHASLLAVEAGCGAALLSLAAHSRVTLHSGPCMLRLALGARGEFGRAAFIAGTRIRIDTRGAVKEARSMMRTACRFSRVPVRLDDRPVAGGLQVEDAFVTARIENEQVEALVGLPRNDDLCRTALLAGDLVARERHVSSQQGFAHVAVVADKRARNATELNTDELLRLVERTRAELYARLPAVFAKLSRHDRRAARDLLFRRCEHGDPQAVAGIPMFRRLDGEMITIDGVLQAANRGVIWAVDRVSRFRRFFAGPQQIFVLDATERAFLRRHARLRFAEPPTRAADGLVARGLAGWRRLWRWFSGQSRRLLAVVLSTDPVNPNLLSTEEHAFLNALHRQLRTGRFLLPGLSAELSCHTRIEMVKRGSLPARILHRANQPALLLPRQSREVRRLVAAFAADPRTIYPAFAVLLRGYDGFGRRKHALQAGLLGGDA